jgi:thiol peroxidase
VARDVVRIPFHNEDTRMPKITLKGTPIALSGDLPALGKPAPAFTLVGPDLSEVTSASFAGRKVILNIFPSVDTGVCAASVRRFNAEAAALADTAVVCVSMDLPFALGRFCGAEGISGVKVASAFRSTFGRDYGVSIVDPPMTALLARAIVIVDAKGLVRYTELVPELAQEPNYAKALAAV